jgi:putative FmdB family regulatory protein
MPKYTFECEPCGLRFERTLSIGDHPLHKCPECKEEAPRVIEGFAFSFASGKGAPGNSGVHDHDYPTADKAVGRESDQRWGYLHERNKAKAKAREVGGTKALIRSDGPGYTEYTPMSSQGLEARRRLAKENIALVRGERGGR